MTDSTDNVRLDGEGALEIVPTRRDGRWYSGRIESRRSDFAPPPGGVLRIEASIALPDVSGAAAGGYWPAFWTMGAGLRDGYTGWPATGEIDVMESVNGRESVFGTLHCGTLDGGPCKEPVGLTSPRQKCAGCRGAFHVRRGGRHRTGCRGGPLEPGRPGVPPGEGVRDGHGRLGGGTAARPVPDPERRDGRRAPGRRRRHPGPATEPGHPMRVDRVTVSTREGAA